MIQERKFDSDEEVIAEIDAYFERKDKLFYKKGIEKLKEHMLMNEVEFIKNKMFSLFRPKTYSVMCQYVIKVEELMGSIRPLLTNFCFIKEQ